ncbi:DUF4365 domain-containing protein [Pseudorhodoferax sp. Leaf265]|uniref:DUF4365 domain-containing protein n=1 Tax=Pseudorhodoferax sp. Leaf265 TaxID=1736315 RepID=UPI00070186E5|nr:DUF4365 domain-containing protein [Pseudorhodoferax sp. Leaf265]KQP17049.1 hypothetical protein ASF45_27920 [Pseudorhodoferax sp. Leaf265]
MPPNLPIADRNRLVSTASYQLLLAKSPANWHLTALAEADFGFDYHVQVDGGDGIELSFFVQLKGTEAPRYVNSGSDLAFALKRTTLNYYVQSGHEVMLIVGVVSLDGRGKLIEAQSTIHWQWMSAEIERLRGSRHAVDLSDAHTSTVHLPTSQVLDTELDVLGYLRQLRDLQRATASLQQMVERNARLGFGGGAIGIQRLAEAIEAREDQFIAFLENKEPQAPKSPQVQEILSLLRVGSTEEAHELIEALHASQTISDPAAEATVLNLRARVALQLGQRDQALGFLAQAHALEGTEERLVSLAEVRFLAAVNASDRDDVQSVLQSLHGVGSPDGFTLLVRVHVWLGQLDQARSSLERLGAEDRIVPELVLLSGQGNYVAVSVKAAAALDKVGLPLTKRCAVELLAARAAWFLATEAVSSASNDDDELPLYGAVGTNLVWANETWRLALACIGSLRALGWPSNVELIASVLCACAGVLGRQREAMSLLKPAADRRSGFLELQHSIELIAVGCDDYGTALVANQRQQSSDALLTRRVLLLYSLGRLSDCVSVALTVSVAQPQLNRHLPMALALGSSAARRLAKADAANVLRARLEGLPGGDEYKHLAEFAELGSLGTSDGRPLQALRDGLARHPRSSALAANLFSNLDVRQEDQAREAVAVSRSLRPGALLSRREAIHLLQALMTLQRWGDAAELASRTLERIGPSDRLLAMAAVAHEMSGSTGKALGLLEQAMQSGTDRVSVVHNYLAISLRLGRTQAVRSAIDRLLELKQDRIERLELLRLSSLIHLQEERWTDAHAAAQQHGSLVDPSIEHEEGVYLTLYWVLSHRGPKPPSAEWQQFTQRAARFETAFPRSRVFWSVEVPASGGAGLDALANQFDPNRARRFAEARQLERQAQDGKLPFPFVLRPTHVLWYVGDAFELWDLAKRSAHEQLQYHLTAVRHKAEPASPNARRDVPMLDLSTLLVLDSLDLFDQLFSIFSAYRHPTHDGRLREPTRQRISRLRTGEGHRSVHSETHRSLGATHRSTSLRDDVAPSRDLAPRHGARLRGACREALVACLLRRRRSPIRHRANPPPGHNVLDHRSA